MLAVAESPAQQTILVPLTCEPRGDERVIARANQTFSVLIHRVEMMLVDLRHADERLSKFSI